MASFQSAAEVPDRDDDRDERPVVMCADCGTILGSHPAGVYVDCEECGGFTLSQWVPEPDGPSDEEIAAGHAAWSVAALRGYLDEERARADAAEAEVARQRSIVEGRDTAPTDAELDAHEAAGGSWLYRGPGGQLGGRRYSRGPAGEPVGGGLPILVRSVRRSAELGEPLGRWWALDANGNICAWPTVPRPEGP
ncbi:MAG: hypothetical protein EPO40_16615 [Myxococcaceae bacterium]|nr:MAG: hypothetical protein EPO40_16615 [Myxococcaceae bacterium]